MLKQESFILGYFRNRFKVRAIGGNERKKERRTKGSAGHEGQY